MTASTSPASDRIHAPVLVQLGRTLHDALVTATAASDNAIDHRQPITTQQAHELLQLTQHIQRAILAAACLDLSDRS